jgi:NTE family protein
MKKMVCFLLAATMALGAAAGERKKVAVVLSGGGAKGVAHIGALKVLEEAGIPIDIITGTSMGSLVGGLYAIGYNAHSLDSIVRGMDWSYVLTDREDLSRQSIEDRKRQNTYMLSRGLTFGKRNANAGGIIKGKNLDVLLQKLCMGYTDSMDFNRLPIPFACVATNIVDNSEIDFTSGILPQAMRASMAIPAVFSPVRIGDQVLCDGGLCNNYPADLARKLGADIVIGVTVQDSLRKADELGSTLNILMQVVDFNTLNKYNENLAITDVAIRVNPEGYSAASFTPSAVDTLLRRGEEEAMRHWDDLMALKEQIGIGPDFVPVRLNPLRPTVMTDKVHIVGCRFENMTPQDEKFLRQKFHLNRLDSIDSKGEEIITTSMRVDLFFQTATSRLVEEGDGYCLVLTAGNRKASQLNLGFRFDTEEMVALQLNANLPLKESMHFSSDITLRLGKRVLAGGEILYHPHGLRLTRPAFSYYYRHSDIDIYLEGERSYSVLYNHHQAAIEPFNFSIRNFNFRIGLRWDYYNFRNHLSTEEKYLYVENNHYFSYRASVNFNSEDDWHFPARGARFQAAYAYHTTNFYQMSINNKVAGRGLGDLSASWRKSFALSESFTFRPMLYGRLLFGPCIPYIFCNLIGGDNFGHYVEQQLPFAGMGHLEAADDQFAAIQLQGQQRIGRSHYVLLKVAAAQNADEMEDLFKARTVLGAQLAYYYNSMFGPLGGTIGYSNHTKTPYFYINLGYEF